jgi:formamidopyrimidine-DNA glycosylase
MIEIPEAINLSKQFNKTIKGKTIKKVIAAHTPHKFTWFFGEPENYQKKLQNKKIGETTYFGGYVETSIDNMKLLFHEGVNLRYIKDKSKVPEKHQILIEFTDGTYLYGVTRMYGGIGCFKENTLDNKYYKKAKEKPHPLSTDFNEKYFNELISDENIQKLSTKAFLATEQRIPGLGNGILQDILYNARIHPKHKLKDLTEKQKKDMFNSIKNTIQEMTDKNGRGTEKDLFSKPGNYISKVCKDTVGKNCKICNSKIEKANYMGGSVYYCSNCQKI